MTQQFTILSCSLDPNSRSRLLAKEAQRRLSDQGHVTTFIDLREFPLPSFDNDRAYQAERLAYLNEAIRGADGVVLAVPIYNWSVGGAAKNLVEITGSTDEARGLTSPWFDQVVTFLVAGGLPHSYTAHMPFATSLMLDFKCVINPYHVYATSRDYSESGWSERLIARLEKTLQVSTELGVRLRDRTYRSGWEI